MKIIHPTTQYNKFRYLVAKSCSLPASQKTPVQPGGHRHSYSLAPSRQVPPFKQGSEKHSSMSEERVKVIPVKQNIKISEIILYMRGRGWGLERFPLLSCKMNHNKLTIGRDSWSFFTNYSDLLVSQFGPVKPGGQEQPQPSTKSWQVPPFLHGLEAHSSISRNQETHCEVILQK